MEITKIFTFDSAHYLPQHKGKCKKLHGHTYFLHVTVKGEIDEQGFVIDFGDLKQIVNPVIDLLDHNYLNDILETPTCENLLIWIENELKQQAPFLKISKLRLYETPTSYAEISVE